MRTGFDRRAEREDHAKVDEADIEQAEQAQPVFREERNNGTRTSARHHIGLP